MPKTVQVRIPISLHKEITKIKRQMERETLMRFGKRKPVTFVRAAQEFQRKKNQTFFGGSLIVQVLFREYPF